MINLANFLRLLLPSLVLLGTLAARAQGVGIGTAGAPAPSATLEIKSTTGGLLLPRMTAAQRNAIPSPTNGLLVFQTDGTPGLYYYVGAGWVNVSNGLAPNASGNAGSSPAVRVSTLTLIGNQKPDGSGTPSSLSGAAFIACDGAGNLYVPDGNAIRKIVAATGVITTLAGPDFVNGPAGYADGTGTSARFNGPIGVAYDGVGNLYVTDTGNNRIRKIVVATGVVSTLAGSGTAGIADGPGATARFGSLIGVAYDGVGNLYVTDGNRIRKIVAATGVVSTLAGNGTAGYNNGPVGTALFDVPAGVACDGSGNVYVAEIDNQCIRKISGGSVTTLAGSPATGTVFSPPSPGYADGTGTSAQFSSPSGVAYDGAGNLYVTDQGNNRIRKVVVATGVVSTLAGTGTTGTADGTGATAQFDSPYGVACDGAGNVYVADGHTGSSIPSIRLIK